MEALTIKNLKKTYEGKLEALKGIDLNVEEGDFFALLGPNGAGKTTTIGIVSSLVNKTSGLVKILGIDIDLEHSLAKKHLGVVGQERDWLAFLYRRTLGHSLRVVATLGVMLWLCSRKIARY
jgi:ABC-2 type transport system ATP-binding protein